MFQLWKLVLLCGLLTGTSASLLGTLENDLTNVVDKVKPVIDKGLETVDNTLDVLLQKVKVDLEKLQGSQAWKLAKEKIQEVENLVGSTVSKLGQDLEKALGLKISNANIQDLKASLAPDNQTINLRIPVSADVSLTLPLIGKVVGLKASLDLQIGLKVETDVQTGLPVVILGECTSDPANVQLTLLDSENAMVKHIVETMTKVLVKTVSFLVQKEMCPMIRIFLHTLDVDVIQNLVHKLQQGIHLHISV
ncbi:BPI fold-containing family A member 2 [Dasypus novemcinctus]|uniref:BPI fold-containing family A member 2 n=1 Tax=Dasypus novemcinctus TaxID=9361 RepID=UPI00062AAE06|nr:BPI fold-containing family A member 2 [Dasypus novemcinctus]